MSAQEDRFRTEGRAGDPNYVPNVEQKFGQIGDFWNRYTKLADQRDKEMLEDLNSDLDTLLIFAGLFSAVNTAFISISFPLLSPDSSSETNYLLRLLVLRVDNSTLTPENLFPTFSPEPALVQVNCFLLSSLGISLLVAAGAMFGKEWLQNYSRTGKPKPFEEPGRHRQRKYDSAMRWGLAGTVKALLNALLASMVLFILGVAQLLFLKNIVVAICVAVVFGSGIILAIATDLMSKFLRHAYDDGVLSMLASYIAADYNNRERTGSVGHAVLGFPTAKWNALLLEAYDGNNLDRNILDALDIGILVFESLDNWDGPAKIYTTFVRTMQSLAIADEAAKLRLTNSLVKLVTKVQWKTPGSVDETRLVGVILRTIKLSAIALDNFQPVETDVSKALWHGLDHIVQLATIRDRAADIDFEEVILDAVDLKSNISGSNSLHAARIEDHPRVVAWLASKLGGFPSETRSWLKLMKKFEIEWFGPNQSLQQVWIDHRFGWRLLGCFRTIKNGDELFLISPVLVKLISFETPKLRQHVIEAGLIPALVDMAIHICKERERFHARWRDGVNLVLEIFYQVWEFSERDRFVTDDKMVAAFKDILPLLESNLRPERDDGKGVHSPLLAGYIHKHRGISAIISHNGDVALNRLYAECDRKVEWGYHLYGEPKTLPCTRTDFASDGMF
ncbi:hypothetical protein FRC01_006962 [Tulasnella sp. 417]|nr:hypothetical protein FRC01_006962 [Tulasnella sp. 417]